MAPAALYPPHENALVSALESERARLVRFCARFTGDATVAEDLASLNVLPYGVAVHPGAG